MTSKVKGVIVTQLVEKVIVFYYQSLQVNAQDLNVIMYEDCK